MMKRIFPAVLAVIFFAACSNESDVHRAVELREKYAALAAYETMATVEILRDREYLAYTLAVEQTTEQGEEQTRMEILSPEELQGVGARITGKDLQITYDDLVLDAMSANELLSAANAVPFVIKTVAEGYLLEQGTEEIDGTALLRLGIEGELGGGVFTVAVFFAADDSPILAEISQKGKNLARIEFTDFAFGAIMPLE